jgi:hypothetical protein
MRRCGFMGLPSILSDRVQSNVYREVLPLSGRVLHIFQVTLNEARVDVCEIRRSDNTPLDVVEVIISARPSNNIRRMGCEQLEQALHVELAIVALYPDLNQRTQYAQAAYVIGWEGQFNHIALASCGQLFDVFHARDGSCWYFQKAPFRGGIERIRVVVRNNGHRLRLCRLFSAEQNSSAPIKDLQQPIVREWHVAEGIKHEQLMEGGVGT